MDAERRQHMALFRYQVIAPLITERLERGAYGQMVRQLSRQAYEIPGSRRTHLHPRTIQRWVQLYRQGGLEALEPQVREDHGKQRTITPGLLDAAIALRREVPARSVAQIIAILEMSGKAAPGMLKRSTLAQHLARAGCTRRAVLAEKQANKRFRRWQAAHRNDIWQGDVKAGFWLPAPRPGTRKQQVYLIAWIDDCSRLAHGRWYAEERGPRLEDCFKRAILLYGIPRRIYVDNGSIYSSKHLQRVCGRLGIRLTHSRPYRPMGRGKVEKLFRYVDQAFVPEAQALIEAGQLTTLEQLNEFFAAWLDIGYNRRRHGATGQAPLERWQQDAEPVRRLDPALLREAFLWEETRKADKTGCISLFGNTYEIAAHLARERITLRYDPYDLSEIQVYLNGERQANAIPVRLQRQRHRAVEPAQPPAPATGLNYLALAKKAHQEQTRQSLNQTAFHRLLGPKEGNGDVH